MSPFLARQERFDTTASTNDVVRAWLTEGTAEVCLAMAETQTAGRGRHGRDWTAPAGSSLLLSLGFRPTWLAPERVWRLVATASLAMADAAEEVAGLPDRAIRLKWPNDLVVEDESGGVRKLAGLLGETDGLGSPDPQAIVGLGINADWPADAFPSDLVGRMSSLRDASGGRPIDRSALLDAFLGRLEVRVAALRGGRFDVADWTDRQVTTGRSVELAVHDGPIESVEAVGVDALSGGLVVADEAAPARERVVLVGEIVRLTMAQRVTA